MEPATDQFGQLVDSSREFARRLFITGENRLELLAVEMQEARGHLLHLVVLAVGVLVCGLFALLALNVAVVVLFWNRSPVAVLLAMTLLYGAGAAGFYLRFTRLAREWTFLSATLDQLRKDRACLETNLP